jgi:hypothetical protein
MHVQYNSKEQIKCSRLHKKQQTASYQYLNTTNSTHFNIILKYAVRFLTVSLYLRPSTLEYSAHHSAQSSLTKM